MLVLLIFLRARLCGYGTMAVQVVLVRNLKVIGRLFTALFGNQNGRTIKRMMRQVRRINALEDDFAPLTDEALRQCSTDFRARLEQGETLEQLLPEAFAAAREAGRRTLGQRHYDVQLIGGMVLHEGAIAEMRTGEGKTLVATLAAYLNALSGEGVHVVTVNDYLARRDSDWMRPLFEMLGLSVGVVVSGQSPDEKRLAYQADISYGTNNEFGFDYLRDNMVFSTEDQMQRPLHYAIIDEVDSILIDEARTPLVISGASDDSVQLHQVMNKVSQDLKRHIPAEAHRLGFEQEYLSEEEIEAQQHYILDEKTRTVELTEKGHRVVEKRLINAGFLAEGDSLYTATNLNFLHYVHAALKAQALFKKDVHYLVKNDEIMIIDEHTGRTMAGRRWSDGIHQAIEAKENVTIQSESHTLASTTFQNYFRLYQKLSGMTGTADTEAFEFKHIYNLDVVLVPTHKPMVRHDMNDLVYITEDEKYDAIIEDINQSVDAGRPVLVGTTSVQSSERLSGALKKRSIPHQVLNAKFHEQEAGIIAQAGQSGSVTIATNMAGRGTDIVLGGQWEAELDGQTSDAQREQIIAVWQPRHDQVIEAGGLHVIGTERHESRRIDNQLRGRSGRQGDPGLSRFYLSMEDDLMRIFASDQIRTLMQRLGLPPGEAIEHKMVTNAIERAQRKVEGRNFDIRKNLLEYDDVASDQRQVIYAQRHELMGEDDISEALAEMREDIVQDVISNFIPPGSLFEQWDVAGLEQNLQTQLNSHQTIGAWLEADENLEEEALRARIGDQIMTEYAEKEAAIGEQQMRQLEKRIMLMSLDQLWKDHLATMDYLRQGISLRAYAQKQPKQEYKREAFELFQTLLYNIRRQTVTHLSRLQIRDEADEEVRAMERRAHQAQQSQRLQLSEKAPLGGGVAAASDAFGQGQPVGGPPQHRQSATVLRQGPKIGRNDPCHCGSGKKYKRCHGR